MSKCYASQLIAEAKKWIGYQEKSVNKDLEDKHAHAGSGNYTIFGKRRGCNGSAWCDAFADDMFVRAFGEAKAKELLGGFSNYTPTSAQYYKNMKRYYKRGETTPKVGDQIFFYSSTMGRICHTGMVYKVDTKNKIVYTIEGNTTSNTTQFERDGGCVAYKQYSFSNSRIHGYGRPKYDAKPKKEKPKKEKTKKPATSTTATKPKTTDKAKSVNYKVKVTAASLRIRKSYSTLSKILGRYKKGKIVQVTKEYKGWLLTSKGWISAKYTTKVK